MDHNRRAIGVIGHKNPDSDSICSAIAYAELKNQLGERCIPLRAGDINNETRYLLEHFSVPEPVLCPDVHAQVRDIDIRSIPGFPPNTTLRKAWEYMRDETVSTLPVTDDNGYLIGLIALKDLAIANMDQHSAHALSEAGTPYANLLETLSGTMLCGSSDTKIAQGKIVVGAASPEIMEEVVAQGDIVLVANRYESQYCAIAAGAGCIIACTGSAVPDSILQLAEAHGCIVISTPYDTYPAACRISQCVPISHYMLPREEILCFRTTDEIEDVKEIMGKYRHVYFPVLDADGKYAGVISRRNLLNLHRKQLILVDHNEKGHCVDGWEEAEILEIIDHHRIGNLESSGPIYFRNQPVGCTATIIYQMYQENGITPSKPIAGILLGAILSDTLCLNSPTCTNADKVAAKQLEMLSETDLNELATRMFEAGESLIGKTAAELMHQDYKTFAHGDFAFGVGGGSFLSEGNFQTAEEMITEFLRENPKTGGVPVNYFMLTSIRDQSTKLLCSSDDALRLITQAFHTEAIPGTMAVMLPGVVSRKKQLVPPILQLLAENR